MPFRQKLGVDYFDNDNDFERLRGIFGGDGGRFLEMEGMKIHKLREFFDHFKLKVSYAT